MLSEEDLTRPSPELTRDAAGIDASLRAVEAAPSDDPSDPEIGYYAAELRNLRSAMLPRIGIDAS